MDPATKLSFDSPLLRVYEDGRVERLFGTETTQPSFDAATGVTSKDAVIDSTTGVFARLYIPTDLLPGSDTQPKKLPILVYFHGGGLVVDSAASPTYHRYLNSLVSKAGVLAVSVNYRLAPEHPIPAAYEDSWTALTWAASMDDPWLSEHGDAGRIFLAGDSGGANIVHNMAIMAGTRDGLPKGALLEGAIVLHPMFGGEEPVDGEAVFTREIIEKLWPLICPENTQGLDDPRLNPMARGAPSLLKLACRKLLVCSADIDYARPRAAAYYDAVKASGWSGTVEWMESVGEEHVFFINKPECDESLKLMDRVAALTHCCGLWIDWDAKSNKGTILTTAHLIRSKHPTENKWKGLDEYNLKADVTVHLRNGTPAPGHYLYHQGHYDLAFFEVTVNERVQFPYFNASVRCGQDVFRLGRDQSFDLRITHGRVEYWNPSSPERYHYMYFLHEKDDCLCDDDGGPVIDLEGKVVGLINNHVHASFVPSSILETCVDLWKKFQCIPRLHLGMKFASIRLLDPVKVEKLWRMHNIEYGLIVEKVAKESHAEKLGICIGDIIERFNGKRISTTIELENMLLGRCKDHFDQGYGLYANIDVSIQIFHPEERLRRTIDLNVEVSDHGEVITKSTYPITATEGTSATAQFSQNVAG